MDGENLTLKGFYLYSEKDRCDRYAELSDHDKFMVRISQDSGVQRGICNDCIYYFGCAKCKAYPDGIRGEHLRQVDRDHNTSCGDGFSFSPK